MFIFIPGIVLRGLFTYETPDVIYAPVIKSWKYSTEAVEPLQNDKFYFVKCNVSDAGPCFQSRDTAETELESVNLMYYRDLYKINDVQTYQLRPFHTPKQFWDTNGKYFFSYVQDYTPGMNFTDKRYW